MLCPQEFALMFDNVRFGYEPAKYITIIELALSLPIDADLLGLMKEVLHMLALCLRPGALDEAQKQRIVTWLEDAPTDDWSVACLMDICMLLFPDVHTRAFVVHRAATAPTEKRRATWGWILEVCEATKI